MKNGIFGAILVAILAVGAVQAEDGRMSSSKLNSLGLSSMELASDADGMQVRGEGRTFASGSFIATAGGVSTSGVLSYGFATRRPNATTNGSGQSVAEFIQIFNGTQFAFAAQAFGNSFSFAP